MVILQLSVCVIQTRVGCKRAAFAEIITITCIKTKREGHDRVSTVQTPLLIRGMCNAMTRTTSDS